MELFNMHDVDDIEMALLCDQAIVCGDIHPELQTNQSSLSSSNPSSSTSLISPQFQREQEIIFAKTRSSDNELYPSIHVFFFLLGSIRVWLDREMQIIPNRYLNGSSTNSKDNIKSQQYFTNNILKIQSKTDKYLSLKFSNETTFLEWHDIVRQSLAQIIINNTFNQSHLRKELRVIDLFDLISCCDSLVSGEFSDLVRVRELIAMKQQISYWVKNWRGRSVSTETMLGTIESFMKRIMLERLDPLIIGTLYIHMLTIRIYSDITITTIVVMCLQWTKISSN